MTTITLQCPKYKTQHTILYLSNNFVLVYTRVKNFVAPFIKSTNRLPKPACPVTIRTNCVLFVQDWYSNSELLLTLDKKGPNCWCKKKIKNKYSCSIWQIEQGGSGWLSFKNDNPALESGPFQYFLTLYRRLKEMLKAWCMYSRI